MKAMPSQRKSDGYEASERPMLHPTTLAKFLRITTIAKQSSTTRIYSPHRRDKCT
ncbi:hypothetical protein SESBI_26576 [Sesbania bispinosa]|nr:hypothetical protein SESBI_26576 [Sesbania bispinosa]